MPVFKLVEVGELVWNYSPKSWGMASDSPLPHIIRCRTSSSCYTVSFYPRRAIVQPCSCCLLQLSAQPLFAAVLFPHRAGWLGLVAGCVPYSVPVRLLRCICRWREGWRASLHYSIRAGCLASCRRQFAPSPCCRVLLHFC